MRECTTQTGRFTFGSECQPPLVREFAPPCKLVLSLIVAFLNSSIAPAPQVGSVWRPRCLLATFEMLSLVLPGCFCTRLRVLSLRCTKQLQQQHSLFDTRHILQRLFAQNAYIPAVARIDAKSIFLYFSQILTHHVKPKSECALCLRRHNPSSHPRSSPSQKSGDEFQQWLATARSARQQGRDCNTSSTMGLHLITTCAEGT
mmetsp:Transcript_29436/g.62549  ORF Transcript_29436/g.62549 Transcript_29436/m.62549 type:complete len:202 (+) Transcript_29436:219-824(+)